MMNKYILIVTALFCAHALSAQTTLSRRIVFTQVFTDEDGNTFDASSDDAEQENDEIDALFDDDIDAGWEGEPDDQNILTCGLRFQDITIPQGATIDSAYIIVNSHEAKTADDVANLTIYTIADDNTPTFTEDALITDREFSTASVDWTVDIPWGLWTYHRTPSLTTIVQEVIDRQGWSSGNAIGFIIAGENQGPSELENAREFESFENIADPEDGGDGQNHPERVPELVIVYSGASSTQQINDGIVGSRLSPNPVDDVLFVNFSDNAVASKVNVSLFGLDGREFKIPSSQVGNKIEINTGALQAGIYVLQATHEGAVHTERFVKK